MKKFDVQLTRSVPCRVDGLPGFSKKLGHVIPVKVDDRAETQLASWVDPWVQERAQALHQALRLGLGLKRADFTIQRNTGAAELAWPGAKARFWAEYDEEGGISAHLKTEIRASSANGVLADRALMEILADYCDCVTIRPEVPVAVDHLIDQIEADSTNVPFLDYPLDAAWLRFTPPPKTVELYADAEAWSFRSLGGQSDLAEIAQKATALIESWMSRMD